MMNIHNANIKDYNCMGYAFNVPYKIEPSGAWCMDKMIEDQYGELIINKDSLQVALENIVDNILFDYKYLIEIANPDNMSNGKEILAFKCAMNQNGESDFHFKVRRNGIWTEKLGDECIHECNLLENESWDSKDCIGYIWSNIVYFVWDENVSSSKIDKIIIENVKLQHKVFNV